MLGTAKKFVIHVVPGVVRPIHILWNQVIGFFFIVLALLPVHAIWRDWGKSDSAPRLVLEIPFAVIMGSFGIHSFLKARKISKS
jgi:hypothetical protein